MKNRLVIFCVIFIMFLQAHAQNAEVGINFYPHKFHLNNAAEKDKGSEYSEVPATIKGSNGVGFFYNRILNNQNGLQADLTFMNQKQFYNYSALSVNRSTIYTKLNTINLGISHNLYLWEYENDDNIFFTYGINIRSLMGYTDYYNVAIETKVNGVVQTETKTAIIENDKMVATELITRNDSIISLSGSAKTGSARYSSINVGAHFGLSFLHYFTESIAFTVGAKGVVYFMDPENKGSDFWSSTSKYKFGNTATSDKRTTSSMSSFGVSLSLIYCIGR